MDSYKILEEAVSSRRRRLWLAGSLISSLILSGYGLALAFSDRYVIQNDARQYVFPFYRFSNPELFPSDWIAEYYTAVAPFGFQMIYALPATIGIDPLFLNKILPMILALPATWFCFHLCREITPEPLAGFVASVLLNQNLWTREDLSSGTPRAFVYPLFLAFCYFLIRKSYPAALITLALQALFFPPIALISLVLLVFECIPWKEKGKLLLPAAWKLPAIGIAVVLFALAPYIRTTAPFGPVIGKTEALALEAFGPRGSQPFFTSDGWKYWIAGNHSGILPYGMRPPLILAGLLLPLLALRKEEQQKPQLIILLKIVFASVLLFFLAHLLLFRLYNPGRYTQHTFPMVLAIASGIVLTRMLQSVLSWSRTLAFACVAAGALVILIQFQKTILHGYGYEMYVTGRHPQLYAFLQEQPESIRVASLSEEADNLPAFAKRTTLVGREYALPYHRRYYEQMRTRANDLIQAQYSPDPEILARFIHTYQVDYLLVERESFRVEWFESRRWTDEFPDATRKAEQALQKGESPAVLEKLESCKTLESENLVLLKSSCLVQGEDSPQGGSALE